MDRKQDIFRGCLLGLAVGDAMGYTVDTKTLEQIQEAYGPNGLLGYDLVNGYADVTSYTQLAAFAANGLLFGMTRGQLQGRMAPLVRYIAVAVREWSRSQHYCEPERNYCWLSTVPELKRRRCMDTWMLATLGRNQVGTMEEPIGRSDNPAALTEALDKLYRDEVLPMIDRGLCVTIYTQITDVEDEINGLYTYDRKICKVDAETMRKITEDLRAAFDKRHKHV